MLAVLVRRLASLIVTLFAVSLIIYIIMGLLPGDPAAIMLGTSASPDTLLALQKQMGLDQPLPLRYIHWLAGVFRGDLGQSYTYGVPVAGLIVERLAVTLPLALLAVCLSVAIAIPLGVAAARSRNGPVDFAAGLFSHVGIAVPGFWVGLLLIIVFSTTLGWMPSGGFPGWRPSFSAGFIALVLPAIALALSQAGVLTRVCRSAVLEVMNEDFVRTARAKGLSRNKVTISHVLRNALLPVVTILGVQMGTVLAGSVVIESVFSWPGIGSLLFDSVSSRNYPVVLGIMVLGSLVVIVANIAVDLVYMWLDPRIEIR